MRTASLLPCHSPFGLGPRTGTDIDIRPTHPFLPKGSSFSGGVSRTKSSPRRTAGPRWSSSSPGRHDGRQHFCHSDPEIPGREGRRAPPCTEALRVGAGQQRRLPAPSVCPSPAARARPAAPGTAFPAFGRVQLPSAGLPPHSLPLPWKKCGCAAPRPAGLLGNQPGCLPCGATPARGSVRNWYFCLPLPGLSGPLCHERGKLSCSHRCWSACIAWRG